MANDQSYSNARFCVDHVLGLGRVTPTVNGAANEEIARFKGFTAMKVTEARATVLVAGKADTSGYKILKGTSSIGQITLGTNAAGSIVDASLTDTDFATTESLVLQNIVATDTCSAQVFIQYQENFPG